MPTGLLISFQLSSKERVRTQQHRDPTAMLSASPWAGLPFLSLREAECSSNFHITSCRTQNQEGRTRLLAKSKEIQASVLWERMKALLGYSADNFAGGETEAWEA